MVRTTYLYILILFSVSLAKAQTSDDAFQRPLVDVLEELQSTYQVRIKYDKRDVGDFMLKYADWRLKPGDVAQSLSNVLAPFDYIFIKQGEGVYKIKPYQYHLITPEAGAESLAYLKGLYADKENWENRKSSLRECIRKALDLDALPENPTQNVIITGKRKYDGYTVENIALETVPGLYLTGSVYKPGNPKGKMPVIITPNGHFGNGRYREDEQLRCAALAKMGALVVSYDLFGWGESLLQVPSSAHRKSIAHTIQTNNAISLLDYLLGQKGVDPERVGITGGSGGGSQTMLVSAIDDRIAVSVPVVMTSSFHSGGCPCESGMPIHLCGGRTNNAEIAGMMAPKPMLIISDGQDWTFQVPEVEFPFIQRIYGFYDAREQVKNAHFADEGHDFGFSKRKAMYQFMAEHLDLNLKVLQKEGQIDESGLTVEDFSKMYVFQNDPSQLPAGAIRSMDELYAVLGKAEEGKTK